MKPLSILIAEDEDQLRGLLYQCLAGEGHTVVAAMNGADARAALARQRFDLVVTDVLMPEKDGLDLITTCKAQTPPPRILAMSGGGRVLGGDDCLRLARGLGAHAVIMKPFDREQLLSAVQAALAPVREPTW